MARRGGGGGQQQPPPQPVRCPDGHENRQGDTFCRTCGKALTVLCPQGHVSPVGAKFCPICGQPTKEVTPNLPQQPQPTVKAEEKKEKKTFSADLIRGLGRILSGESTDDTSVPL